MDYIDLPDNLQWYEDIIKEFTTYFKISKHSTFWNGGSMLEPHINTLSSTGEVT